MFDKIVEILNERTAAVCVEYSGSKIYDFFFSGGIDCILIPAVPETKFLAYLVGFDKYKGPEMPNPVKHPTITANVWELREFGLLRILQSIIISTRVRKILLDTAVNSNR